MRTTIAIDDDLLNAAKALALQKRVSLGAAISELMRRGLEHNGRLNRRKSGFPVFDVPRAARPITLETVQKAEEDQD